MASHAARPYRSLRPAPVTSAWRRAYPRQRQKPRNPPIKASPPPMPTRARQAGLRGRAHAASSQPHNTTQEGQARSPSPNRFNKKQCSRWGEAGPWPAFEAAASRKRKKRERADERGDAGEARRAPSRPRGRPWPRLPPATYSSTCQLISSSFAPAPPALLGSTNSRTPS
jgi:hypothetical protein